MNTVPNLDLNLLGTIDSSDIVIRLSQEVNERLRDDPSLKELYDRARAAIHFFLQRNDGGDTWLAEAKIRAGLNDGKTGRRLRILRSAFENPVRHFQPIRFDPDMLSLSECGQSAEILSGYSRIHVADSGQRPPERGFPEDPERQCFESLKGSDSPIRIALELQPAYLFRNPPCGHFKVEAARWPASVLISRCKGIAHRLAPGFMSNRHWNLSVTSVVVRCPATRRSGLSFRDCQNSITKNRSRDSIRSMPE